MLWRNSANSSLASHDRSSRPWRCSRSYGSVEAFIKLLPVVARPGTSHGSREAIWRRYGVWLLFGLEFELASDIIGTVVSPTWQDIGELDAIAVIRTS